MLKIFVTNISTINTIPLYIPYFFKDFLNNQILWKFPLSIFAIYSFQGPIKTFLIGMTSISFSGALCSLLLLLTSTAHSPSWQLLPSLVHWLQQLEISSLFSWCKGLVLLDFLKYKQTTAQLVLIHFLVNPCIPMFFHNQDYVKLWKGWKVNKIPC